MKRVRMAAVTAVALGVVVTAGTQFQRSGGIAPEPSLVAGMQAESGPALVPVISDAPPDPVPLAVTGSQQEAQASEPALASSEAPSLIAPVTPAPEEAGHLTVTEEPAPGSAPQLVRASVLPAVDLRGTERATGPAPAEDLLRQLADTPAESTEADVIPLEAADPDLQAELDACAIWLVVTPAPGAMLDASVYAPCDGGSPVTITHAGLSFDTRLGPDGQLMAQIPALVEEASVSLAFADGRVQEDRTIVPDLASVKRVALLWQSPAALLLHAYEFGAAYGEEGHVHAGSPGAAGDPGQGFLTILGDPSLPEAALAQVYSYPGSESPREGQVVLEIEVPVTEASCGRELTATSFELQGTASAQVRQIRMALPECDGAGGFVVLPGVLPDLQVALN